MQKITTFLWFNDNAEEAVNFYISVFKDGKIGYVSRYGDTGPGPEGSVMVISFFINGQEFMALNGGPIFKFTEAISLVVNCENQQEIDEYWEKLSEGGDKIECGWLKDKYGLSWQIVPSILGQLLGGDPVKSNRVMKEVMKMKKLDIATMQQAYDRA